MNNIDIKDEIAFIKKTIEDSKQTVGGGSLISIVWGVYIVVCTVLIYLYVKSIHAIPTGWYVIPLSGLGWLYTIIVILKRKKQSPIKTFGGKIFYSVWITCGIVITCLVFYTGHFNTISRAAILPVCCMIIGIGYYVTSDITASAITKLFAILWWIGALVMMTWPGLYIYLLFPCMSIVLIIIPGIKNHLDSRKQLKGTAE
jgi:hypothetical protein